MSEDAELRVLLRTLTPHARDDLRRVLIRGQADRDAISSQLLRYRDGRADDWADIIDGPPLRPHRASRQESWFLRRELLAASLIADPRASRANRAGS